MPTDLLGTVTAATGLGLFILALLYARRPFWLYAGGVLLAGGLLIIAFSH
jgi:hypothetical protein